MEYKYLKEMHANEVAILPYYIANLNIEYSYKEKTGKYLEFPNLCFVDTLDNLGWQEQGATGGAVQRQSEMILGGISEENWIRVQEQNEKPISVIIGNPPYNDSAILWGDGRDNWAYAEVDKRISETYVREGNAQKTHQYDMYKRFLRWASDRLADDGIIGFITNRAYLDARQDDGFRKVTAQEFTQVYVLDLSSDVRRNPKISGSTHNVFGIQTGVAIGFFVREKAKLGHCRVHYAKREDVELARDKLAFLKEATIDGIAFSSIIPDKRSEWLNQSNSDFEGLMALANRVWKANRNVEPERTVFQMVTPAIKSNRDHWVYDFGAENLKEKVSFFADTYTEFVNEADYSFNPVIKWSSTLQQIFLRGGTFDYVEDNRVQCLWRPYVAKWFYSEPFMNDRLTNNHYEMFGPDLRRPNQTINFCTNGKDFYVLAANRPTDFHFTGDTQCLPLYRYTAEGERVCNITDWGIRQFNDHYRQEWGDSFR